MKTISAEKAIKLDAVYMDVRTSKEFNLDHLPDAVNIPIFDNKERKEIGILYKKSQEKAYELGYDYFEKKLPLLNKKINKLDKNKKLVVYCWRGGKRSEAITNLVDKQGYDVYQLKGGYKSYRAYIRKKLYNFKPNFKFIVLRGLAGCGKTDLIKRLSPSIDLENLAQHRSSIFGAIGLKPNTQKRFESLLFQKLKKLKNKRLVFVEGESHKIGNLFIPKNIFSEMNKGITVKIERSIEKRAEQIVKDYFTHGEEEKIKKHILSLKQNIGKKTVNALLDLMDKKEYKKVSRILLEKYYDKRYKIQGKQERYTVNSDSVDKAVKELKKIKELKR